jgi:hypothetical protein
MASPCKSFAAFLTHDWGNDELSRNNHRRVVQVAQALKARGLPVWIDEDEMTGDIVEQMCNGIENSNAILVFITERYVSKVGGSNAKDNCKLEFKYAARMTSPEVMIPVVMEERMCDSHSWSGPVGFTLGGTLYVKMWEDDDMEGAGLEQLVQEIVKRCPAWQDTVTASKTEVAPPIHATSVAKGMAAVSLPYQEAVHVQASAVAGAQAGLGSGRAKEAALVAGKEAKQAQMSANGATRSAILAKWAAVEAAKSQGVCL